MLRSIVWAEAKMMNLSASSVKFLGVNFIVSNSCLPYEGKKSIAISKVSDLIF